MAERSSRLTQILSSRLPEPPITAKNSREKLLTTTTADHGDRDRSSASRKRSRKFSVASVKSYNEFLHPSALLVFTIMGLVVFIGAWLLVFRRSPTSSQLTSLPSELSKQAPEFHSALTAIASKIETMTKLQSSQGEQITKLQSGMELQITKLQSGMELQINNLNKDVEQLKQLQKKYESIVDDIKVVKSVLNEMQHTFSTQLNAGLASVTKNFTKQMEQRQPTGLKKDDAYKLNDRLDVNTVDKVDWARSALGSSVNKRFTTGGINRNLKNTILSIIVPYLPYRYDQRLPPASKPADIIIGGPEAAKLGCLQTETLLPGHCYAIPSTGGNITINLPAVIDISQVRIDHLNPNLSPNITTAPKTLRIYSDHCQLNYNDKSTRALSTEKEIVDEYGRRQQTGYRERETQVNRSSINKALRHPCWGRQSLFDPPSVFLGQFLFDYPNVSSKLFTVNSTEDRQTRTRRVRFEILDNHGNEEYTCVYRLRVYGSRIKGSQDQTEPKSLSEEL